MPNARYKTFGIRGCEALTLPRTKIKDIALAAGVSITTVSHALNNTRYVSPTTKAKIREIATRLQYRPDHVARMLLGGDSLLIGHILSDAPENSFFPLVARGADIRAKEAGYATIISYTRKAETEEKAVELLLEKRVNGLIFTTAVTAAHVARAVAAGVATVMIERPLRVPGAHAVVTDHRTGVHDLTKLLINQGHRDLAYLGGSFAQPGSASVERQRFKGFRDALEEANLTIPKEHVFHVPFGITSARAACQDLLSDPTGFTGLVIGSDMLAAGALQVLYSEAFRCRETFRWSVLTIR